MTQLRLVVHQEHLIAEAYQDFVLSRKASRCSPATVEFYGHTAGVFVSWLEEQGVSYPEKITAKHVREYLAELSERGLADRTVHAHARGIRCLVRFFEAEEYVDKAPRFDMPRVAKTRPPMLSPDDLPRVLAACLTPRDTALVLFLIDSGVRRGECCALTWGDLSIESGLVRVERGKGGKSRSVVVGLKTRRSLLKWRRRCSHSDGDSLFGLRPAGMRMCLKRIGDRAGVRLTGHMIRRTFATLSLRAGISPFLLQALMGHANLQQTQEYLRLVDDDLLQGHQEHGPVDHWMKP